MPDRTLSVKVFGTPAPQGSKNPWGGESSKRVGPWRDAVSDTVGKEMTRLDYGLLYGPVDVRLVFSFPRPKNHFKGDPSKGILRDTAPYYHTSPGDLDKLCRAVFDAMTGVVYKDDKQVASLNAIKVYHDQAFVYIVIRDLAGGWDHESERPASPAAGKSSGATDPRST